MSAKGVLLSILIVSIFVLVLGAATGAAPAGVVASPDTQSPPPGLTIPYGGRLSDELGQPVAAGIYDFSFALYAAQSGSEPLWQEQQLGVTVTGGAFAVVLGNSQALPEDLLGAGERWLAVGVRGPAEDEFTTLGPRQRLSDASMAAPASPSVGAACAHDHWNEAWEGGSGSIWGLGLKSSVSGASVGLASTDGIAVTANGNDAYAVAATSNGTGKDEAAVLARNTNTTSGMAAYLSNKSAYHTAHVDNAGKGGVLFLQNNGNTDGAGGGDFVTAVSRNNDMQFRVTSAGEVGADDGFVTPLADIAEMLPAVDGLEPGDVLAIGADARLARSVEPYQATVAGVYSTQPGFVGGQPLAGDMADTVPLAVVGVVPVKVSAENGAIQPGDLLVASATPGHAMLADPNPPQGTVIGKALGKLDSGTGLINILATLQ